MLRREGFCTHKAAGVKSAVFGDDNLVSCAGLVPVMALAAQTGLTELLAAKVRITKPKITSGSANPAPKLSTLIAGMCAGADSIDDVDVVRSGGMKTMFGGVYAPSTIGTLLREFTFGHARQLESVLQSHLAQLCGRVDVLPGAEVRAFVDIDSLLRPVYGHTKQGASYGHSKIAGKQILRKGLSPLATTISTDLAAPVIAGMRLRAGRAASGRGAARDVLKTRLPLLRLDDALPCGTRWCHFRNAKRFRRAPQVCQPWPPRRSVTPTTTLPPPERNSGSLLDGMGWAGASLTCERGLPTGWSWPVEPQDVGGPSEASAYECWFGCARAVGGRVWVGW